jgi:large subunit ribosomal protein L21
MYAVIETGGKQYRVEVGTELEVELLEVTPGQAITLDRVLLIADGDTAEIGRPLVPNAIVAADVLRQTRGEKLISFKYRPKARRRVKKGHRQELTVLRISDIVLGGRSAAVDVDKAAKAKVTERQRLEEGARRQAEADAALAAKLARKVDKPAPKVDKPAPKATAAKATAAKATTVKAAPAAKATTAKAAPAAKAGAPTGKTKAAAATAKPTKPSAAKAAPAEPKKAPAAKPARSRTTKKDG